jgi:enoyl-CoA hydratase
MAEDVLLVDIVERVATITLNRPGARHALNRDLRRAIPKAVRELDADDGIDVLIITGADPAFCAGLDLKELGSGQHDLTAPADEAPDRETSGRRVPLPKISKPIIGAINGVAVTGGFELALNCDFLIASERARFADTHARVGVQPGWGLTVLLPQAIGIRRAKEMSATGNYIDADTALEWGLVNHVVSHDDLLPFCQKLAADIVSNDAAGVRAIFHTYDEGSEVTAGDAWRVEATNASQWLRSGGGRADEVERRRQAIVERGRGQAR